MLTSIDVKFTFESARDVQLRRYSPNSGLQQLDCKEINPFVIVSELEL